MNNKEIFKRIKDNLTELDNRFWNIDALLVEADIDRETKDMFRDIAYEIINKSDKLAWILYSYEYLGKKNVNYEKKRLTTWSGKGAILKLDNPQNEDEARAQLREKFKLAMNKLAMYEDKEEEE